MRAQSFILSIAFIFFAGFSSYCQTTVTAGTDTTIVPDKFPEFKKGLTGWTNFLVRNLDRDVPQKQNAPLGRYTVIASFIVGVDGSVSDIKIESDRGYGTAEEVKRILKLSDKNWLPAYSNGTPVPFRHRQSITFVNQ